MRYVMCFFFDRGSLGVITDPCRHVMKSLLADFDILMNVGEFQNIEQIDRSAIGKTLLPTMSLT